MQEHRAPSVRDLFSPVAVGPLQIENRIVTAPLDSQSRPRRERAEQAQCSLLRPVA